MRVVAPTSLEGRLEGLRDEILGESAVAGPVHQEAEKTLRVLDVQPLEVVGTHKFDDGSRKTTPPAVEAIMHQDDPDLTDDLRDVATLLRHQRAELSGLELDHIKQRAMGLGSRSNPSTRKSTFMRSRSVITALLASGIVMTGGSAALGVSSLVGGNSASQAQYGPATPPGGGTLGTVAEGTNPPAGTPGGGTKGVSATKDDTTNAQVTPRAASSPAPAVQPARQIAATNPNGGQLPFTGFAAIPILLMGLALLASGVFLHRYGQRSPTKL